MQKHTGATAYGHISHWIQTEMCKKKNKLKCVCMFWLIFDQGHIQEIYGNYFTQKK